MTHGRFRHIPVGKRRPRSLTEVSSQLDDRETAELCDEQLLPFEGRFARSGGVTVVCLGSVALFLGMAAMTLAIR